MICSRGISRRAMLGGVAATLSPAALLAGCGTGTWGANFLLRIAGMAGSERVAGHSVIRTEWTTNSHSLNGIAYTQLVQGEAVILPAGLAGTFFGLVAHPVTTPGFHAGRVADLFSPYVPPEFSSREAISSGKFFQYVAASRQIITVPRESWPVIARFEDLRNPKSVEIIPPAAASEGDGAAFRTTDVTIEATDKPATHEIERILPWLGRWRGNLGGTGYGHMNSVAESLARENFIMTEITDAGH
jgi:hypothetical protein